METRTPLDSSHDLIVFTVINDATNSTFQSQPFRVAHGTGWIDPNGAKDDTGATPVGNATYKDALGRTIAMQDPLLGSAAEPGITCGSLTGTYSTCLVYGIGTVSGDTATYEVTTSTDGNKHVSASYADALSSEKTPRIRYVLAYSGLAGGTLTASTQTATQYNALNKPTSVTVTDLAPQSGQSITSVNTTATYDDLGQVLTVNDPDRGAHSYSYDPDSRLLTDVSGTRTIGSSYDLLGRVLCIQDAVPTTDGSGSCSSGSHPLVQNSYDSSKLGTAGSSDFPIGKLTQSISSTYYPDGTVATTTQQVQHDQRGRAITTTLQIGLPTSWNVTTALPTYQQTQAYNDADQTTTVQTSVGGQASYAFTQVYDSTTGLLTGLSNNGTAVANLATLGYENHGLLSDLNFQTTTGTALANDHFSFDGNLRPASSTATWQSGSGSTGTIFVTNRAYDPAGNVVSSSTTHAAVAGQSNSGGSETQNFCYDELNRLLWAGNSGTQPAAGNGTCGTATLSNSFGGNVYSNSYAYTHLGQIWQGPVNGTGAQSQYLYCDSSHPHQLTGLYPTGTTCSSLNTASYSSSYDAWGNVKTRTYNSITANLSFDVLDHFVQWDAGAMSREQYLYDASGQRVLRRSTTGAGTSMTVYAFGLEEHVYDGSGNSQSATSYYSLAGHLIGELSSAGGTQFFLTDALGSVLSTFNAVAGAATILGNQVYGPYGNTRYTSGSMGTAKGYTGQYADTVSGLDYYNARYYDPVVGLFLTADTKQDNLHGFDPYAYVSGNPETKSDPTGHGPPVDFWAAYYNAYLWFVQRGYTPQAARLAAMQGQSGPTLDQTIAAQLARETEFYRNIGEWNQQAGKSYRNTNNNLADALLYVNVNGKPSPLFYSYPTLHPQYGGIKYGGHSEAWLMLGAERAAAIFATMMQVTNCICHNLFNLQYQLHMVLFTQLKPCPDCANNVIPASVRRINQYFQVINQATGLHLSFDVAVYTYQDQSDPFNYQPGQQEGVVQYPIPI